LPHRDNEAGSGQSNSLIVALGDIVGVVESTAHDIRNKPLVIGCYSLVTFGISLDGIW
jgi:hypothetical protein